MLSPNQLLEQIEGSAQLFPKDDKISNSVSNLHSPGVLSTLLPAEQTGGRAKHVSALIESGDGKQINGTIAEQQSNDQILDTDDEGLTLEQLASANTNESGKTTKSQNFDVMLKQLEVQAKATNQPSSTLEQSSSAVVNTRLDAAESQIMTNQNNVQSAKQLQEVFGQKMPLHEQFAANALKERVSLMVNNGLQQVVIQLDPEELGAMSIRIQMNQDQLNVQFQVQNPAAKEMLEQAMGKLKEMLEQQGIVLNQSDVGEQSQGQAQGETQEQGQKISQSGSFESTSEPVTMVLHKQSANGIDYYA